ncbi:MAG: lipoprotein [Steroidobacteraceae bacterium]|jgi:predicted small lipoprotein YifL
MRNFAMLALTFALGVLTACGQKGPLVLPDAQKHKPVVTSPAVPQTVAPATQTKDDKSADAASTP